MSGVKDDLTSLHGNPDRHTFSFKGNKRGTSGSCRVEVLDPSVNILGATTTEYLQLDESHRAGGFLGRHLLWYADASSLRLAFSVPVDKELKASLHRQLENIAFIKGEAVFSAEARSIIEAEYFKLDRTKESNAETSFASRITDTWKKLAILLQIAEDGSLTINCANVERSIKLTAWLYACYKLTLGTLEQTKAQKDAEKIKAFLQKKTAPVKRSTLLQNLNVDGARALNEALDVLGDKVKVTEGQKGGNGRAPVFYEWAA